MTDEYTRNAFATAGIGETEALELVEHVRRDPTRAGQAPLLQKISGLDFRVTTLRASLERQTVEYDLAEAAVVVSLGHASTAEHKKRAFQGKIADLKRQEAKVVKKLEKRKARHDEIERARGLTDAAFQAARKEIASKKLQIQAQEEAIAKAKATADAHQAHSASLEAAGFIARKKLAKSQIELRNLAATYVGCHQTTPPLAAFLPPHDPPATASSSLSPSPSPSSSPPTLAIRR